MHEPELYEVCVCVEVTPDPSAYTLLRANQALVLLSLMVIHASMVNIFLLVEYPKQPAMKKRQATIENPADVELVENFVILIVIGWIDWMMSKYYE